MKNKIPLIILFLCLCTVIGQKSFSANNGQLIRILKSNKYQIRLFSRGIEVVNHQNIPSVSISDSMQIFYDINHDITSNSFTTVSHNYKTAETIIERWDADFNPICKSKLPNIKKIKNLFLASENKLWVEYDSSFLLVSLISSDQKPIQEFSLHGKRLSSSKLSRIAADSSRSLFLIFRVDNLDKTEQIVITENGLKSTECGTFAKDNKLFHASTFIHVFNDSHGFIVDHYPWDGYNHLDYGTLTFFDFTMQSNDEIMEYKPNSFFESEFNGHFVFNYSTEYEFEPYK